MATTQYKYGCHANHAWITVFLVMICSSVGSSFGDNVVEMFPKDPAVEEGYELRINCTITSPDSSKTSSDLYFMIGNKRIDDNLTVILNSTIRELRMPNMPLNMSLQHFYCYDGPEDDADMDHVSIVVARRPMEPNITSCIVHNWLNMTCKWTPTEEEQSAYTGVAVQQTLYYSILDPSMTRGTACQSEEGQQGECSFKLAHALRHAPFLWVEARNQIATELSELKQHPGTVFINLVMPDPVKSLKGTANKTAIDLQWIPPSKERVLYSITYKTQWDSDDQVKEVNVSKDSKVTLTGLIPYAVYTISVKSRPLNNTGHVTGFWSKPQSITVQTSPDVPGAAPEFADGAFVIKESDKGRDIEIYIKPIPEPLQHGKITHYRVRYSTSGIVKSHEVSNNNNFNGYITLVDLCKNCEYTLVVDARTKIGYNENLTLHTLTIPSDDELPPPPSIVMSRYNGSTVYINWMNLPDTNATKHTVFLCHKVGATSRCKDPVDWVDVPGNITHWYMERSHYESVMQTRFAVSTRSDGKDSQMVWVDCLNKISGDLPHPGLHLSNSHESGSMLIHWKVPSCNIDEGYVYGVELLICEQSCTSSETESRTEIATRDGMKNSLDILVEGLQPWTQYEVQARSLGFEDDGEEPGYSVTQKIQITGSGLQPKAVIGVSIGGVIIGLLVLCGIFTICWRCKKCVKKTVIRQPVMPPPLKLQEGAYTDAEELPANGGTVYWSEALGAQIGTDHQRKLKKKKVPTATLR